MWNSFLQDPLVGPLVHGLGLGVFFMPLFFVLLIWAFFWKIIALWHSARRGQRLWFIAFLIFNTVGILEIVYLKWFEKDAPGTEPEKALPFVDTVRDYFRAKEVSSTPGPQ